MISDNNPLCCCEYFDINEERNHILACCCNCQDFDEGFSSFIFGRGIPRHNQSGFMATFHDRLRIPWKSGAKRISAEVAASVILVPTFLVVASASPLWTVVSGCTMIVFLFYIRYKIGRSYPRTKFFFAWTNTSFVVLYLVFEFVVIPFLEILWEENVALSVIIALSCFFFWRAKKRRPADGVSRNCAYCSNQVPSDSSHCVWLDCCIGQHNSKQYLFGLIAATAALLYGCNLTLTTVCHPFTWFATILLPDDCSEAYDLFELSLSFVSGLYSLGIAVFFFLLLVHRTFLIVCYTASSSAQTDKRMHENFIA